MSRTAMTRTATWLDDYTRIERAIVFLDENFRDQPRLEEIAATVHLSPFHFQRLFTRWAGISPKRFLQTLTLNHAKATLAESRSVLDAAFDAGLSGPSRLHDLFVTHESVTPGEFKRQGQGLHIDYGFHATPFGECLLAVTGRGICALGFVEREGETAVLERLAAGWPRAELREAPRCTGKIARLLFGTESSSAPAKEPVRIFLHGTAFQIKVWEALLRIPTGALASYDEIARRLGKPGAARAVGRAVAENPIAYLIPCHRVIRKSGAIGEYRWGAPRKRAMLAWEAGQARTA